MSLTLALYELADQYKSLMSLAESDDIPPEIIRDTLDGLEGDLKAKAIAVTQMVLNLKSAAEAIDEAGLKMRQRAGRLMARSDSLKAYLLFNMQAVNMPRVECDLFLVRRQNNPKAVVVDDEKLVPDTYKVQPETPPKHIDKAAVLTALNAGKDVPGCHTEQGEHLRIVL